MRNIQTNTKLGYSGRGLYLVVVKALQLITGSPPSGAQGWSGVSNSSPGACPSSIPCALESTVVECANAPPPPAVVASGSLFRWQSLEVIPFIPLVMVFVLLASPVVVGGVLEGGVLRGLSAGR